MPCPPLSNCEPERWPNGLGLSCPAEAGNPSPLYASPTGQTSTPEGAARLLSFRELLGARGLPGLVLIVYPVEEMANASARDEVVPINWLKVAMVHEHLSHLEDVGDGVVGVFGLDEVD